MIRPKNIETTALGAATLAGLAVGLWSGRDEIARQWAVDETFTPARPKEEMAALRTNWERAVDRSKAWEKPGPNPQ